jgi:hypothetical protein
VSIRARRIAAAGAGLAVAGIAAAGGPLVIRANGQPFVWSTSSAIQYRTDSGPLSASVSEAQARARVNAMFAVWQDVPSASISYHRAGFINSAPGFGGGDVDTAAEFNAIESDCANGNQSPIVYDADATIFKAIGIDETSVIGFAGPCALNDAQGLIVSGRAVMNGLFQDGKASPVPDLTAAQFDATFIHEFGHFSGLDHSQINVECASGPCGADNLAGLPTMFPFLVSSEQGTLSTDDVAWISRLYPANGAGGFAATHGTITGTVYFSDGESQAQLVNVIARRVDTGANEDRRIAASAVSGNRFRVCHPNPITNPTPDICPPSGSENPNLIGLYEIPVPAGSYTVEVESIDPQFTDSSSVGPSDFPIPMPGTAPAPLGPIPVSAGQTQSGNDVILIGTPPRFDQFEGPGP